jgi:2-aminoethylphosphonate aminotransferase
MKGIKRNILLNPGPATTTDTVKHAMVVPDICPREEEFSAVIAEIRDALVQIAQGGTDYTSVLFGGSGTAVMDAVINSVVPPRKKLAVVVNGAYGRRMFEIAAAYAIPCVEIAYNWGARINPENIKRAIENDGDIACLAMVHHETITGILNPVQEIGTICRDLGRIFIVDAISSFAGIPFNISEFSIDFMLSTSNKCLQGMAGLSFAVCRKTEIDRIKKYPKRSFYLDLYNQFECFEKSGQFLFTPPVQVIYAFRQAINEFCTEGSYARRTRYDENYTVLKNGLRDLGFRFLLPPEDESRILITVMEPDDDGYDFASMHDFLYARGFTIYPGKLHDSRTFRLSVIGALNADDMHHFLAVLKDFIAQHKLRIFYDKQE